MIMNLKELTAEMQRFVTAKGWYEPNSPRQQTAATWQFHSIWNHLKCWNIFNGPRNRKISSPQ
jgi:hypothetical protein